MIFGNDLQTLVVIIVSIVLSLSIHEMMHAYVGLRLGDTTAQEQGRVSLNPLQHIDPFTTVLLPIITFWAFHAPILAARPVPFNPARVKYDEFGAALIALAGPLSNLGLAILGVILAKFISASAFQYDLLVFAALNVGLFVFNMIPIPPLDGSRVLYAFAPESLQELMAQIESFGVFIVFGLVLAVPGFSALLVNLDNSILQALLKL